jgi:hypothetical protein
MKCDGCTLCCKLLDLPWVDSPSGLWCRHCNIGVGCKIWNDGIPIDCFNYKCVYNDLDNPPIELRPDKCKIIFENVDSSIILGTMHPDYNESYKKKIIRDQVEILLKREMSVVFTSSTIDKSLIFPTQGRQISEIWSILQLRWKEKHDSTFIYN